jgi:uncharacterized protein YdaU (DUF1376 family)
MNATRRPWLPLYIDDFRASPRVGRMSLAERGAYLYLLMACWEGGGRIKDDPEILGEALDVDPEELTQALTPRVRRCFQEADGWLVNPRMLFEVQRAAAASARQAEKGRLSAAARRERAGSPQPSGRELPEPEPNHGSSWPNRGSIFVNRGSSPPNRGSNPINRGSVLANRGWGPAEPRLDPAEPQLKPSEPGFEQSEPGFKNSEPHRSTIREEEASSCFLNSEGPPRARGRQATTLGPILSALPIPAERDHRVLLEPEPGAPEVTGPARGLKSLAKPKAPGIAQDRSEPNLDPKVKSTPDRQPGEAPERQGTHAIAQASTCHCFALSKAARPAPDDTEDGEFGAARQLLEQLGVDLSERWGILRRLAEFAQAHGQTLPALAARVVTWIQAESAKRPVANPGGMIHAALEGGYLALRLGIAGLHAGPPSVVGSAGIPVLPEALVELAHAAWVRGDLQAERALARSFGDAARAKEACALMIERAPASLVDHTWRAQALERIAAAWRREHPPAAQHWLELYLPATPEQRARALAGANPRRPAGRLAPARKAEVVA